MTIFNDTECADVDGVCRYIEEMTFNHFLTVTIIFFCVVGAWGGSQRLVSYLYCLYLLWFGNETRPLQETAKTERGRGATGPFGRTTLFSFDYNAADEEEGECESTTDETHGVQAV